MESYKDFNKFLEAVKSKDSRIVKLEIINMFIALRGDKSKVIDGINYAIRNKALLYEKHTPSPKYDWVISDKDKYTFESGYLEENFSKERINEVFRLYNIVYKKINILETSTSKSEIQPQYLDNKLTVTQSKNNFNSKNIVIIIVIIISAIVLLIKNLQE